MIDWMDWVMAVFVGAACAVLLAFLLMLGAAGYFTVECYRSGDPKSMACFVSKGSTSRVDLDADVRSR